MPTTDAHLVLDVSAILDLWRDADAATNQVAKPLDTAGTGAVGAWVSATVLSAFAQ